MSFSTDVKNELLGVANSSQCCDKAQIYGLLLFGKSFSASEISISLENKSVASYYKKVLDNYAGGSFAIKSSSAEKMKIRTINKAAARQMYESFGYSEKDRSLRINWANFTCENCYVAFLRGSFLSCGTITSPDKGYHLEFSVPFLNLCKDFKRVFIELGFEPKQVTRNGYYILYFKDSEMIEDLLTAMGAVNSSLELMSVKVYKDVRNNINRRTNFETANLDRIVNAENEQKDAIRIIQSKVGLNALPVELRQVALLRMENDGLSLRELGEMCSPPLSRSGVNHRLKKIVEFSNDLK
ncbi:MAG: DNA-binding protein WhiA [Clostridiales bacterium]|nr:DNA-binding protein WhiA [Clostridia bacterium]MCR4563170.1 DNA-binding protein WhiA [Clostridiales bacterium]